MPVTQVPISQGIRKEIKGGEYIDAIPVNMLAVPKNILDASGYMRSFPGIVKLSDVSGVSRGVQYNAARSTVYRVIGNDIYQNDALLYAGVFDAVSDERVNMAYSATSQAVAAGGTMHIFRYDGTRKTLTPWPASSGYTVFPVGSVNDITRNKGRYIWSQNGGQQFGVTDLDDESHPDRAAPYYTADSQPDGIVGVGTWNEYVLAFGSSSIEYFELTGASGGANIYASQPSLMINYGIAGTHAKCEFMESWAILTGSANGQPGVYVLATGSLSKVSTATIDRIIDGYSAEQLKSAILESFRINGHELLIMHLPNETLCYDATGSANGPQWCQLQSGLNLGKHRGIDYCFDGEKITLADSGGGVWGYLDPSISSQYDEQQEHVLFTPLIKGDNTCMFDLELEASTGFTGLIDSIQISATTDGVIYGAEQTVGFNRPADYDRRVIKRKLGRVRRNIGFRLRCISKSAITLSDMRIRIEI